LRGLTLIGGDGDKEAIEDSISATKDGTVLANAC